MEKRYKLFSERGVRDIQRYNLVAQDELPYIVIIIDELADLMMISPAEVEDSIVRLSQMSRAAGIYLVIATQRPSVDVITGLIKANITSRIAFTVSSQADSRTILDTGGAEKLLGRGDMLFSPVDAVKPFRIQGAYIGEKDLQKVVDYVKKQGEPEYIEDIIPAEADDKQEEKAEIDELFPEAVELVVRVGQASISLLQRRFRIGYTRAARLIDDLEKHGIVSGYEGSKPRAVLINAEQAAKFIGGAVQNLKSSQAKEV
jgi:S-DNA-T family DNA segregation ATPase FtsK/SpoIIIE